MNNEDIKERFDKQDEVLSRIEKALIEHLAVDKEMKPSLDELVSLWKGSKIVSGIIAGACAIGAGVWALIVWANDHIK